MTRKETFKKTYMIFNMFICRYCVDTEIVWPGFASTTSDKNVQKRFATAHILKDADPQKMEPVAFFEIYVLSGRLIDGISRYPNVSFTYL